MTKDYIKAREVIRGSDIATLLNSGRDIMSRDGDVFSVTKIETQEGDYNLREFRTGFSKSLSDGGLFVVSKYSKAGSKKTPVESWQISMKSRSQKKLILESTDGHCWLCGSELAGNEWREVDIGADIVPSCKLCSNSKASMDIEEMRRKISKYLNNEMNRSPTMRLAKRIGVVKVAGEVKFWGERNKKGA